MRKSRVEIQTEKELAEVDERLETVRKEIASLDEERAVLIALRERFLRILNADDPPATTPKRKRNRSRAADTAAAPAETVIVPTHTGEGLLTCTACTSTFDRAKKGKCPVCEADEKTAIVGTAELDAEPPVRP